MEKRKIVNNIFKVLSIFLAIAGGYFAYQAMTWGPWAYSDSSAYVSAARNFALGNGLNIVKSTGGIDAITEFPPLFSIVLSIFGGNRFDYLNTIRWWNIFLFSSSIFLFSQIIFHGTGNHYFSVFASMLFVISPQIMRTYTSAMSEPLFLFLILLLLFLYQLIIMKRSYILYPLFFFLSSLLPITRYAGMLFVGIFGIGLFIVAKQNSLLLRIRNFIIYYLVAFLPIGFWGFLLIKKFNQFGGKYFSFKWGVFESIGKSILEEIQVIKLWIPYVDIYQGTIRAAFFTTIGFTILFALFGWVIKQLFISKKEISPNKKYFLILIVLLIIGYISFIGLTHSITIPQIDIIDRMMVPIYPLLLICIFLFLDIILVRDRTSLYLSLITFIIASIGIRYNAIRSYSFINSMKTDGEGFTARAYQQSGIIDAIRSINPKAEMISNSSGFVLFYTDRYPIQVNNFPYNTFGIGDSYGEKSFREKNAALIILYSDFSNYYGENSENLLATLTDALNASYIDTEGGIYYFQ